MSRRTKLRRTRAYDEGQDAFHMGNARDPDDLSGEAREAYLMGFDEAAEAAEANKPTEVEAAVKDGNLDVAIMFADASDDVKAILSAIVERLP